MTSTGGPWVTVGVHPVDQALSTVASHQGGVFARRQAVAAGASVRLIQLRRESGRWLDLLPGVYGFPGTPDSWPRRLWVAFLHAGPASAISHEAAGQIRGLESIVPGRVVLIVPRDRRHPPDGVTWHRLDDLDVRHVRLHAGLPVTTAARTILDLASVLSSPRLKLATEQVVVERQTSIESIGSLLADVRRRGKPGVRRLESVLDLLGPGDGIPRSELERLLDSGDRAQRPAQPATRASIAGYQGRGGIRRSMLPGGTPHRGGGWTEMARSTSQHGERPRARSGGRPLRLPDHPARLGAPLRRPIRSGASPRRRVPVP